MSRRGGKTQSRATPAASAGALPRAVGGATLPPRYLRAAALLGAVCFLVYMSSLRKPLSADTVPTRLLPFSILRQGNLDLDEFAWLRRLDPHPYFLRKAADGHFRSRYPVSVAVLVTPLYLPVNWWLQHQQIDDDDVRFRLAVVLMERIVAALIAAASVSLVFLAAVTITDRRRAAVVALLYAFATPTWAISSQALWQHGPAELALAGLGVCLVSADTRRAAVAAGGLASLSVLARPTMAIFAMLAALYMWRERRARLVAFLIVPLAGLLLAAAYFNARLLHFVAPAVPRGAFGPPRLTALLGLLASPNRGLFVYVPLAALAVPTLLRPPAAAPRWVTVYARIGVGAYLLLYSAWSGWWAGHSYGPRFLTDLMPVLALGAIPVGERLWRRAAGRLVICGLVACSVAVQVIGVYCDDNAWNALPQSIDRHPDRVWDWRDPQILRAANSGWHAFNLPPLIWQAATNPRPARLEPLLASELTGQIAVEEPTPLRYRRARANTLRVRITNLGGQAWPAFSDFGLLQVSGVYRWWAGGRLVAGEGGFIPLPRNLAAGESISVRATIDAPKRPGHYELEIVMSQILDVDNGMAGNATVRVPVENR